MSTNGLTRYNPRQGLATIAVAEAAEKHYARAKDVTQLTVAIRAKLEAQAEFVFWWDTQAQKAQGRPGKRNGSVTVLSGTNGLPDRMTISRWRRKLNDPAIFDQTVAAACARYVKILEFQSIDAQLKASGAFEWYTPARYVEAARAVLGQIDLDPASTEQANRVVKASRYFSQHDDGLRQEWSGRVWLNPPYGGLSASFTARLLDHVRSGTVTDAIVLVNSNSTDAGWFQPLWEYLLCFTDHRIAFQSSGQWESGSTHGSVFVYCGPQHQRFMTVFSPFGAIVQRARAVGHDPPATALGPPRAVECDA